MLKKLLRNHLILIVPILLLFADIYAASRINDFVRQRLLEERRAEMVQFVNILCTAVGTDTNGDWEFHKGNLVRAVEYLDKFYQTYAALYRIQDGHLTLVSERFLDAEDEFFDPDVYPEFHTVINESDTGEIPLAFNSPHNPDMTLWVHWRILRPDNTFGLDWDYLIVTGVHHGTITTQSGFLEDMTPWVSTVIAGILVAWITLLHLYIINTNDKKK
jgi:hypothetical protein